MRLPRAAPQSSRLRGKGKRLLGGGHSFKSSAKAAVFKRTSLVIGGARPLLGSDPATAITEILAVGNYKFGTGSLT